MKLERIFQSQKMFFNSQLWGNNLSFILEEKPKIYSTFDLTVSNKILYIQIRSFHRKHEEKNVNETY